MRFDRSVPLTRRWLIGAGAAAAASLLTQESLANSAPSTAKPGDRLNVACIGMGGRMDSLVREISQGLGQNVVALCDVDSNQIANTVRNVGDVLKSAKVYSDYRKLLANEKKNIDAVIVATPDHWHVPICTAVIHAGKHIYCEKPLAHTVGEARHLRELSRKSNVVTQTGNQGSASDNMRRCIELIQAGMLGQVREVHIWHPTHGWPSGVDRPEGEDPIPAGFDWNFWLGSAPPRPYKKDAYHPVNWRGWYDFGSGSLGDFCCHAFNLPVRALRLEYPHRIEVSGENLGKESFPNSCSLKFHFAERGSVAATTIFFYTGGAMPPAEATRDIASTYGSVPNLGCLLLGENGTISAGLWNSDGLIKMNGDAGFKGVSDHEEAKKIPQALPRVEGHMKEWVDACKGGPPVFSNFDFGGHLTEIGLSGVVALRLGHDINWDGEKMRVVGAA